MKRHDHTSASGQMGPIADHHQHLFSPAIVAVLATGSGGLQAITARDVVTLLDAAGIRQALLLSVAYMYGSRARTVDDEYARGRDENDLTGDQAAESPDRLRAFCGFNPLKEYALDEIARCASSPHPRHGMLRLRLEPRVYSVQHAADSLCPGRHRYRAAQSCG